MTCQETSFAEKYFPSVFWGWNEKVDLPYLKNTANLRSQGATVGGLCGGESPRCHLPR